ncbi:hypothetical protein BDB00DRAFT_849320 [Zychaea mexicana]|uniref:uncharacterized protein n=1 Tax=Zychaea mexicana TaxID=64656 RepID=UPI0022FEC9A1|nr:uncharacterized protein BDB00DRAFT_849320 [Zychaea mexicana]KAI9488196.1 hypothetical protein BDB00DRAFT_849320 [Zychaea mexicana]
MSLSTETVLSGIHWTRTIVLVLAILIVATSLSIYSTHTIPIFSLFSRHDQTIQSPSTSQQQLYHTNGLMSSSVAATRETTVLLEMIQDRRLISTLVAAQASVFCPLFLLLTSNSNNSKQQQTNNNNNNNDVGHHRRAFALDLICCHVIMPFGLALSWIFCILFDRKTVSALNQQQPASNSAIVSWGNLFRDICLLDRSTPFASEWVCFGINAIHGLKYLIVLVLFLEIELVIAASLLTRYQRRPIQLENNKADDEWNAAGTAPAASFMDDQQRKALLRSAQNQH